MYRCQMTKQIETYIEENLAGEMKKTRDNNRRCLTNLEELS